MLGKIHTGRYETHNTKKVHSLSRAIKDIGRRFAAGLNRRLIERSERGTTAVAGLVAE